MVPPIGLAGAVVKIRARLAGADEARGRPGCLWIEQSGLRVGEADGGKMVRMGANAAACFLGWAGRDSVWIRSGSPFVFAISYAM